MVTHVGGEIGAIEACSSQACPRQVAGDAGARKIGAIELCADELRGEQARAPQAGAGEIGVERPGLIQRYAVEIGSSKVRAIEARRLQIGAPEVEPRQIQAIEALGGEIDKPGRIGRGKSRLDFGPRHVGLGEIVRLEIEKLDQVLGRGGVRHRAGEHGRRWNCLRPNAAARVAVHAVAHVAGRGPLAGLTGVAPLVCRAEE